jgi:hypothetical protein
LWLSTPPPWHIAIASGEGGNHPIWADSAYRPAQTEKTLQNQKLRSKTHRNKSLTKTEKKGNNTKSSVRSRVEQVSTRLPHTTDPAAALLPAPERDYSIMSDHAPIRQS